jgi:hypothetical protein
MALERKAGKATRQLSRSVPGADDDADVRQTTRTRRGSWRLRQGRDVCPDGGGGILPRSDGEVSHGPIGGPEKDSLSHAVRVVQLRKGALVDCHMGDAGEAAMR